MTASDKKRKTETKSKRYEIFAEDYLLIEIKVLSICFKLF